MALHLHHGGEKCIAWAGLIDWFQLSNYKLQQQRRIFQTFIEGKPGIDGRKKWLQTLGKNGRYESGYATKDGWWALPPKMGGRAHKWTRWHDSAGMIVHHTEVGWPPLSPIESEKGLEGGFELRLASLAVLLSEIMMVQDVVFLWFLKREREGIGIVPIPLHIYSTH